MSGGRKQQRHEMGGREEDGRRGRMDGEKGEYIKRKREMRSKKGEKRLEVEGRMSKEGNDR